MKSGIYIIKNHINGKFYSGSAVDIEKRIYEHVWALRNGRHCNIHLQRAWDKNKEEVFSFEKYLICKKEDLIFNEQLTIDASIIRYGRKNIYNISPTAGSSLGRKHSEATKIKIGLTSKGRWTGKHHTEETKRKIRLNNIGKNKGKRASPEARKKMSEARRGKKFSKKWKLNLSKSLKKYWERRKEK